jgi:cardiolipin synthase A/B
VVIDHYSGKGASAKIAALLKKNNVPTSLSPGGALLHHKFLYIDGKTLVNGSANWTKAAFAQNDDCFLVIHDLTQEQHDQMEDLWSIIQNSSIAY